MCESSAPGESWKGWGNVLPGENIELSRREKRADDQVGRHPDALGSVRKDAGQRHVREVERKPRDDGVLEAGEESMCILSKAMGTSNERRAEGHAHFGGTWRSSASLELLAGLDWLFWGVKEVGG